MWLSYTQMFIDISWTQVFMDITDIDLFDLNVSMICAKVGLRYSWISPVLIYLIKMWVWHVPELDSDVHGYHWYQLIYLIYM